MSKFNVHHRASRCGGDKHYHFFTHIRYSDLDTVLYPFRQKFSLECLQQKIKSIKSLDYLPQNILKEALPDLENCVAYSNDYRLLQLQHVSGCTVTINEDIKQLTFGMALVKITIVGPSNAHITTALILLCNIFPKLMENSLVLEHKLKESKQLVTNFCSKCKSKVNNELPIFANPIWENYQLNAANTSHSNMFPQYNSESHHYPVQCKCGNIILKPMEASKLEIAFTPSPVASKRRSEKRQVQSFVNKIADYSMLYGHKVSPKTTVPLSQKQYNKSQKIIHCTYDNVKVDSNHYKETDEQSYSNCRTAHNSARNLDTAALISDDTSMTMTSIIKTLQRIRKSSHFKALFRPETADASVQLGIGSNSIADYLQYLENKKPLINTSIPAPTYFKTDENLKRKYNKLPPISIDKLNENFDNSTHEDVTYTLHDYIKRDQEKGRVLVSRNEKSNQADKPALYSKQQSNDINLSPESMNNESENANLSLSTNSSTSDNSLLSQSAMGDIKNKKCATLKIPLNRDTVHMLRQDENGVLHSKMLSQLLKLYQLEILSINYLVPIKSKWFILALVRYTCPVKLETFCNSIGFRYRK